jgi:Lrp/AsnC family transcriptional regulator, leucine-responsive regulatory protein
MNPAEKAVVDDIDRKILRALTEDGRLSFRDLSERVFLSPNATAERVRQLQSKGIFRRFQASLNPAALLGVTLEAYIDVKLQTGTSAQHFEAVVAPGVVSMAILTGSFDMRLRVVCKDQADLVRLIETLRTRAGAEETNSSLICREVEPRNWNL